MVIRLFKFLGQAWDLKYVMPGQAPGKLIDLSATASITEPLVVSAKIR
jgi:hypothetical protein